MSIPTISELVGFEVSVVCIQSEKRCQNSTSYSSTGNQVFPNKKMASSFNPG